MPLPEQDPRWQMALERINEAKQTRQARLDLPDFGLGAVPDTIGELSNLSILNLPGNRLVCVPEFIRSLRSIHRLHLGRNQIEIIPDFSTTLPDLSDLELNDNWITVIPESLAESTKLKRLSLAYNKITQLPASIVRLKSLEFIDLRGNPLPDELLAVAAHGVNALFRYLEATATKKVYPRTIKLVLLGEPESGKTTLLEALKGNKKPCSPDRKETVGVDVVSIQKPHPSDHQPMYLSTWDFAGQHMEHATHQFFLTENAIYLILWDGRLGAGAGKRDVWYWLELLRMRVRNPKYFLVATHTELTPSDINLSEIESDYPSCQGHYPVELENLKGFDALETRILELAAESPSLQAAWSPEWLAVRNAVRELRKEQPHMSPDAFVELMLKHRVTDPLQQKDLANQLHDLGEILYFQERDELSNLVILDPNWVTGLIALVVRSAEVRARKGVLTKADLTILWQKAKTSPEVRSHLIKLMDSFDLTCATEDRSDVGLVVEALPYASSAERAAIELASSRPQMEMIFRFPSLQRHLPPGIPTWAIARAHRYQQGTPWRDAAAFKEDDTKSEALILASDAKKEIRLRVTADYPPFFFGVLQAILVDTFKRYPEASPERLLPCNCKTGCPASFKLDIVMDRSEQGAVMCPETGRDVPIQSLLSGLKGSSTEEAIRALRSEIRRLFTEQLRSRNEEIEKTCPSVFTLVPAQGFKQLDTWIEYATKDAELELALYCEHESGWHPTSDSLYRFQPSTERFESLKKYWNQFAKTTKKVASLAKIVGKASGFVWKESAEVASMAAEFLPEAEVELTGRISSALGAKRLPEPVELETRYLLKALITDQDAKREVTETKNGGLHPYIVDDGRLLWLCPDHIKTYKTRVN
jgi:internalin A